MKNIFITGAIGFLGWDLTKELLKAEGSKLYLLVREKAGQSPEKRVESLVNNDFSPAKRKSVLDRIRVISGDITRHELGVDRPKLDKLYGKIDTVYHCAALCEFNVALDQIRRINVTGTKNTLDFALRCKEKGRFETLHHVSTIGIAGKSGGVLHEDHLDLNQKFSNSYEQSKFEAEKLVEEYRKKGLSVSVYRPSIVVGNSITGEVSNFQMFYQPLHIFSLEIFDKIPADITIGYNLVPVDCVARAIFLISLNQNNNKNYHLTNPNTITIDFLLDVASSFFGFKKPRIMPQREFDFNALSGFRKRVIDPYLPYFNHKDLRFDTTNFKKAIDGSEFSWPLVDKGLLLRLFKYCVDVKYIKYHK